MDNDWALVVGINRYPVSGGRLPELSGAVRDAEKFFAWVTDPLGGAVPNDNIHAVLLTSPQASSADAIPSPVRSGLYSFVEQMQHRLNGQRGRRLYLYLSGHGISPITEQAVKHAALLMADTQPPALWPTVTGNVWAAGARSSSFFREVVLIMDCCRDLNELAHAGSHPFQAASVDATACHLVEMYAADWGSQAREAEFGEPKEMMGIFSHSLLEVLKAGKMNGSLLKASVLEHLSRQALPQQPARPDIQTDDELALIIFNEAAPTPMSPVTILNQPASAPPEIRLSPPGGGRLRRVDVSTWEYRDNQWRGTLSPGTYQINLPSGDPFLFIVYAGLSETVDMLNPEVVM